MNHPSAEDLHPLWHFFIPGFRIYIFIPCIYLKTWLNKREICRSHSDFNLFLKSNSQKILNNRLKVCNADIFVNIYSFKLIKHSIVSRIYILKSIDPTRQNSSDWNSVFFDNIVLSRGGMSSKNKIFPSRI